MRKQLLLIIFVVSGFTGLIYESIWSHYLKLFLGHAAYAQTLVLAIFMGGMALGSWIVSNYSARLRRLLLGYVAVEGLIGILGLVFHRLFVGVTDWSFDSVIPALTSEAAVMAYKWSLAALLILPQSTLLGMTFPLISGGIIRRWPERSGETLSLLYFANSLGAAVGVLVSGFVLIRTVGLPGTILTAGLLNVALALSVWAIVRRQNEPPPIQSTAKPLDFSRGHAWFLLAAFLTGAASFLYEIGWIRMLSLALGSSTHSFELMLSAFIFGLAFGGLWMRKRIERIRDPARYLGVVMLVMGGLALLTLPAFNKTFDFMQWALATLAPTDEGYAAFNLASQAVALIIMIPTTFCAGMTLPLLTHALLRRTSGERAIGAVYAANTLGAIVGVLVAVHLAMPFVGVKGVIMSGAAIHMALGLSAVIWIAKVRPIVRISAAAACIMALLTAGLTARLDPLRITSGVYRTGLASQPAGAHVKYLRDGKTATISVVDINNVVSISTNGKPDASIQMGTGPASSDEITMILAAGLPLSMHPHPERVANIGFGSGLTSHTILGSARVKRLDSIEIEPFMVQAARAAFYPRINRVFEDPRSHIVYEDAKTFFATVREPYDIIISEPSNPWVSGVATLFSSEFYHRLALYLQPDGYFVQWLQIYETDMSIVSSIIKALSSEFQNYAIYNADDSNVLIIASRGKLHRINPSIFDSPALRADLAHIGVESVGHMEQRRIGTRETLLPLIQSYPVPENSDFFPFVDLNAARLRYRRANAIELPSLLTLPLPLVEMISGADKYENRGSTPSSQGSIVRDALVAQSQAIRDSVLPLRFDSLGPTVTRDMLIVQSGVEQCRSDQAREAWRIAVRTISDLTTPFLPGEQTRGIWNWVKASLCYRGADGPHKQWADLLASIAARNLDEIVQRGSMLLASPQPMSANERAYVLVATAAALVAGGSTADAHELLGKEIGSFEHPALYDLALRQLLALSRVEETGNGR